MIYTFVVNALIHCIKLLDNNFGKENIYEIILDAIGSTSQYAGVPYHLRCIIWCFKYKH